MQCEVLALAFLLIFSFVARKWNKSSASAGMDVSGLVVPGSEGEGGGEGGRGGELLNESAPLDGAHDDNESNILANKIKKLINDILHAYLHRIFYYDPTRCSRLCHDLCETIKARTKELSDGGRHKLVINVIIGQDLDQSFHLACRSLTDPVTDNMASGVFRNKALFAIAVVYGVQCCRWRSYW